MPETRISAAVASDLTNAMKAYSVDTAYTDGATGQKETEYTITKWNTWLGYYKNIPELSAAIDAKATWTVGKGFTADDETTAILEFITGFGKDTFNTILENMIRNYNICGDAFAEVIRDKETGDVVNLKVLDPSTIKIVANDKGIIKRYEQTSKVKNPVTKFKPQEIFHLARNRIADEIHGQGIIEKLEKIILMRNEAMTDISEVYHRFVKPKFIFHLDTDDPTEIAAFKSKMDTATGAGENMYVPKDAVIPENLAIAQNATMNPLPWIEALNHYFFQACGVPRIIVGGSQEFTEATAKIAYLAFQQTVEEEQLYIEESVRDQLGLIINLEFPASLDNELLSDTRKDKGQGYMGFQPNDTTAGSGQ